MIWADSCIDLRGVRRCGDMPLRARLSSSRVRFCDEPAVLRLLRSRGSRLWPWRRSRGTTGRSRSASTHAGSAALTRGNSDVCWVMLSFMVMQYPELFPTLLGVISGGEGLARKRALFVMHVVVKVMPPPP